MILIYLLIPQIRYTMNQSQSNVTNVNKKCKIRDKTESYHVALRDSKLSAGTWKYIENMIIEFKRNEITVICQCSTSGARDVNTYVNQPDCRLSSMLNVFNFQPTSVFKTDWQYLVIWCSHITVQCDINFTNSFYNLLNFRTFNCWN